MAVKCCFMVIRQNKRGKPLALGEARLIADADNRIADLAMVISSSFKGKGLGSRLMQSIMHFAREQGLTEIEGLVLARNAEMLKLMKGLGFDIKPFVEDPDFKWATKDL